MHPPSDVAQEIRRIVKERSKAPDVAWLMRWLLTHFTDEGKLRGPQSPRRKTMVLDGRSYWLVERDPPL